MTTAGRLVSTEYAFYHDPRTTRPTTYGRWTTNPDLPTRHDANQLFDVRCGPDQMGDLLTELEALYEQLGFVKVGVYWNCLYNIAHQRSDEGGFDARVSSIFSRR